MKVYDIIKILERTKDCMKLEEYECATNIIDVLIKKLSSETDVADEYMNELIEKLH